MLLLEILGGVMTLTPTNDIRCGDGGSVRLSVQSKDAGQSCGMEVHSTRDKESKKSYNIYARMPAAPRA